MKEYLITPKYDNNVSERTIYTNYAGTTFTIERYYETVDIIVKCDEEPVIDIDCVFGANLVEYLVDKYPECDVEYSIFHCSGIKYPSDMPEDLKEKMEDDPYYELTDDGLDVAETELWGYTQFSTSTLSKGGKKGGTS
jgi:hypothetical protein